MTTGIITATGIAIKNLLKNVTVISEVLRNASPVTHSDWEKKSYILVDGKRVLLNDCDETFEYMFKVLTDKEMPFEDKKQKSFKLLINNGNLRTTAGLCVFCFALFILFIYLQELMFRVILF